MLCWVAVVTFDIKQKECVGQFKRPVQVSVAVMLDLVFQVEFFLMKQNYTWAMDVVNQVIASYPTFTPALTLKMAVFLASQDWEHTREMCDRCARLTETCSLESIVSLY